ncbi:MAG: hypothetical protein A2Y33_05495 [Spirochaetes bacterium GWF1_51_8]|nr:MAG: hypothetical protein A2Y33_05495 [Spirochaetes bacterium GWF1_51_8]
MKKGTFGILLVEDNPADARLVKDSLRGASEIAYRLDHAESLQGAFKLIAKHTYSLAILDLTLPDGKGIDAVMKIKELAPDTEIIVFTEYNGETEPFDILKEGIDTYLIKGRTNADTLKQNIGYVLEKSRRA